MARLFAGLPTCGKPIRLVVYDLHTLQNRFYFSGHVVGDLCTAIPLLHGVLDARAAAGTPQMNIACRTAQAYTLAFCLHGAPYTNHIRVPTISPFKTQP